MPQMCLDSAPCTEEVRRVRDPDDLLNPDELWQKLVEHVMRYHVNDDFPVVASSPEERDYEIARYCRDLLRLIKLYVYARYRRSRARSIDVFAIAYQTRSVRIMQMLHDENMRRYVALRVRLGQYVIDVLNRCLAELQSMDIFYARGTLLKDFINAFRTWLGSDYIACTSIDSLVIALMTLEQRATLLVRRLERLATRAKLFVPA